MKFILIWILFFLIPGALAVDFQLHPCVYSTFRLTDMVFVVPEPARQLPFGENQNLQAPYTWECGDGLFSVASKGSELQFKWQQHLTIDIQLLPAATGKTEKIHRIEIMDLPTGPLQPQVTLVSGLLKKRLIQNRTSRSMTLSASRDFQVLLQQKGIAVHEIHYFASSETFIIKAPESGFEGPTVDVPCDPNLPFVCI